MSILLSCQIFSPGELLPLMHRNFKVVTNNVGWITRPTESSGREDEGRIHQILTQRHSLWLVEPTARREITKKTKDYSFYPFCFLWLRVFVWLLFYLMYRDFNASTEFTPLDKGMPGSCLKLYVVYLTGFILSVRMCSAWCHPSGVEE